MTHPHIKSVRESLENWKGQPARSMFVNDERYMMVEVSIKAIQELIDLLEDVEHGVVRGLEGSYD